MQATGRPNEAVSQQRIVIPRFNHSCLRLHSQAFANALGRVMCDLPCQRAVPLLNRNGSA